MKKTSWILLLPLLGILSFHGCKEPLVNPNYPSGIINFTIYPNDITHYYDLNIVSGWMYLTSDLESTSRGIIVYRLSQDEFLAYDRLPPNEPNACCDPQGNCTRLVVDFPYVVDHCNNAFYNILNGELIMDEQHGMLPLFPTDSAPVFPLIQYHTSYNGSELHIYN